MSQVNRDPDLLSPDEDPFGWMEVWEMGASLLACASLLVGIFSYLAI